MTGMTSIQAATEELRQKLERARSLKPPQNPEASPEVQCETCHDRGYIEYVTEDGATVALPWHVPGGMYLHDHPRASLSVGNCDCLQRKLIRAQLNRLMGDGGVPMIYRTFSFETWDNLPERDRRGKEAARLYCEAFAGGNFYVEGQERYGLVLSGDTGRGKTGLASCTLMARAQRGQPVLWIDFSRFIRRVKDTYQDNSDATYEQVVGAAARVPFLFVDDMGDMKRRGEATDHTRDVVYDVVSERYNELRPTLITTNLSFIQFKEQFGDRIAYRILQLYHWVDVHGTNMRIAE